MAKQTDLNDDGDLTQEMEEDEMHGMAQDYDFSFAKQKCSKCEVYCGIMDKITQVLGLEKTSAVAKVARVKDLLYIADLL